MPSGITIDYTKGWNDTDAEFTINADKVEYEKMKDADKEVIKKTRKLLRDLKKVSDEINK